jgi:hypothetical protein
MTSWGAAGCDFETWTIRPFCVLANFPFKRMMLFLSGIVGFLGPFRALNEPFCGINEKGFQLQSWGSFFHLCIGP